MPAPGDQYGNVANPFEEPQRRISEFTAQEVATLQSRLQKQLGPEYLSARSGPSGQKVHYIAAEKCIALANEVFGFNGWSSSIQNIQVDFIDEHPQTLKISLGLSVVMRVTLRDGTFHEDVGYGHIENCKGKAAAFEKAKKEGTTDALKRALRNFGNVLGNCIYDKAYLAKVTKMKVEPTRFDEGGLHRHSDFVKKEPPAGSGEDKMSVVAGENSLVNMSDLPSAESLEDLLGDFDEADFCVAEEEHPDEVSLPSDATAHTSSNERAQNYPPPRNNAPASMQPPSRPIARSQSAGSYVARQPQTPNHNMSGRQSVSMNGAAQNQYHANGPGSRPHPAAQNPNQQARSSNYQNNNSNNSNNNNNNNANGQSSRLSSMPPQQQQTANPRNSFGGPGPSAGGGGAAQPGGGGGSSGGDPSPGFFSARAVKQLPEETLTSANLTVAPQAGQQFNPHAESPSIRKTPGIDHTKSKPVARNGQHVPPASGSNNNADGATGTSTGTNNPRLGGGSGGTSSNGASGFGSAGGGHSNGNGNGNGNGNMSRPGPSAAAPPPPTAMGRGNVANPQFDQARRIGAPGAAISPLANRGQYRPPTMKRPAAAAAAAAAVATAVAAGGGNAGGGTRIPLDDVSNRLSVGPAGAGSGPDAKRQKIG